MHWLATEEQFPSFSQIICNSFTVLSHIGLFICKIQTNGGKLKLCIYHFTLEIIYPFLRVSRQFECQKQKPFDRRKKFKSHLNKRTMYQRKTWNKIRFTVDHLKFRDGTEFPKQTQKFECKVFTKIDSTRLQISTPTDLSISDDGSRLNSSEEKKSTLQTKKIREEPDPFTIDCNLCPKIHVKKENDLHIFFYLYRFTWRSPSLLFLALLSHDSQNFSPKLIAKHPTKHRF